MSSHTIRREYVGKCSFEDYLRVYIHTKEHSRPQYPILLDNLRPPDPPRGPPKYGRENPSKPKNDKKTTKNSLVISSTYTFLRFYG